jgi:hypothetical protein
MVRSKWYVPYRARQLFRQQATLHEPFRTTVTGSRWRTESRSVTVQLDLSQFVRWREDDERFLLYQSDYMINNTPKRWFETPEDVVRFRRALTQSNGP